MDRLLLLISIWIYLPFFSDANPCELTLFHNNGLLLTKATINNTEGYLIIDTGAPDLVLNKRYFEGKCMGQKMIGMENNISTNEVNVSSFVWGCMNKKNKRAMSLPMDKLENALNKKLLGLIGYRYLKQKALLFDFDQQLLIQLEFSEEAVVTTAQNILSTRFRLSQHLPLLKVNIANQKLLLGFDTGATINVIDSEYARLSKKAITPRFINVVGLDDSNQLTTATNIPLTQIGDSYFEDMTFVSKNLQRMRDYGHYELRGFLGFPFLQQCQKLLLNYRKRRIDIWQRTDYLVLQPD